VNILDELESDYQKAECLQNLLVARATGDPSGSGDYQVLRKYLISKPAVKEKLPNFVITNRDLSQFWQFIKYKHSTYTDRKNFIWSEFCPLLESLETSNNEDKTFKPIAPIETKQNNEPFSPWNYPTSLNT